MAMAERWSHAVVCVALAGGLAHAGAGRAGAAESVGIEVLSLAKLPRHDVVLVRAALSGSFGRPWDASPAGHVGSHRIPVWLAYPLKRFQGAAIVEPMHPAGGTDYLS